MAIQQQTQRLTPQVHIKSPEDDDGLTDLVRSHTAQKVEERKEVTIIAEDKFKDLWGKYKQALSLVDTLKIDLIEDYLDGVVTDVLTPTEIEEFLRLTIAYEDCKYYQKCTTKVINKLIENSYKAGYSEFVLDTRNLLKPLDNLCNGINGNGEKPIHITINGDVGNDCGSQVQNIYRYNYVSFTINGDVGSCGSSSSLVSFTINGNVDYITSPRSGTSITINGNIWKNYFVASDYSSLAITGEIGEFEVSVYSKNCKFKTSNSKTLDVFLKYTPLMRGHKIYFINEDGTETKIGSWERFVKRVGYKLKEKKEIKT